MSELVADGTGISLASPGGQFPLAFDGECLVSADGTRYSRSAGAWQILDQSKMEEVSAFSSVYARVRAAEGRGSNTAQYYRALPDQDLTGRFEAQWAQRAAAFTVFKAALSQAREPGVLVDVGAGNCWLAARMAAIGWTVLAIDINADPHDGLGAAHHHGEDFCVAQATMDAMPLADRAANVVVFNASIHYARDVLSVFGEGLRVLGRGGTLVVMDSPVYDDPAAGETMVADASRHIESELGVPAAPLAGQGFVTDAQLAQASELYGLVWSDLAPPRAGLRSVKRRIASIRAGRELARRPVLFGSREETCP